jgi:hypothetical protein
MMRAEMVLRGHLSRDQYESVNAWASWYMNEKYPDPLARCAEKCNSEPGPTPPEGQALREDEARKSEVRSRMSEAAVPDL